MLEILYNRVERIALGKEKASAEEIVQIKKDHDDRVHVINITKFNKSFKISDRENLRLLSIARPAGYDFPLNIKSRHFRRNLCLRYGINLTTLDKTRFKCTKLAFANNYYGYLQGHDDKLVLIALFVNEQNKAAAKFADLETDEASRYRAITVMLPKELGDFYLSLERKYCPLGADHEAYSFQQLLEAHKDIAKEMEKKA